MMASLLLDACFVMFFTALLCSPKWNKIYESSTEMNQKKIKKEEQQLVQCFQRMNSSSLTAVESIRVVVVVVFVVVSLQRRGERRR